MTKFGWAIFSQENPLIIATQNGEENAGICRNSVLSVWSTEKNIKILIKLKKYLTLQSRLQSFEIFLWIVRFRAGFGGIASLGEGIGWKEVSRIVWPKGTWHDAQLFPYLAHTGSGVGGKYLAANPDWVFGKFIFLISIQFSFSR